MEMSLSYFSKNNKKIHNKIHYKKRRKKKNKKLNVIKNFRKNSLMALFQKKIKNKFCSENTNNTITPMVL